MAASATEKAPTALTLAVVVGVSGLAEDAGGGARGMTNKSAGYKVS